MMAVLIYGSLLFVLAFILHVILWRIHLPRRQTKALLVLFFGVLICGSLILHEDSPVLSLFRLHPLDGVGEMFQIWLFFVSLTLAYMITYSAVEVDSPSLLIILRIAEAGDDGLSRADLEGELNDRLLVEPRVRDLLADRMAERVEGKYRLSLKGLLMARLFLFYRTIMGAGKGG